MIRFEFWPTIAFAGLMISWFAFVVVFMVWKKPPSPPDTKRERKSIIGIALQGCAYAIAWIIRRPWFTPFVPASTPVVIALSILTIALAAASVWLSASAINTLGKQWSLAARLIEGHKLVTEGPYNMVRNPIYTGMFGMLIVSSMAHGHWLGLIIASFVYYLGTVMRIKSEEKLLREQFGSEYDDYTREVPAFIPIRLR